LARLATVARLQNFGFDAAAILPSTRHRTAPRLTPFAADDERFSVASIKWLAMLETEDVWLLETLFIIFIYFIGFISGFFVRASFSQYRRHNARKAREAPHARPAAAEGEPR
jgi:hypothetical protein